MKYELYLQMWSHLNPNAEQDKDYETFEFVPCDDYRDAVKQAKKLSKEVPFEGSHGTIVQRVQLAAYYDGDFAEEEFGTTYALAWRETYQNGKGCGRHNCL